MGREFQSAAVRYTQCRPNAASLAYLNNCTSQRDIKVELPYREDGSRVIEPCCLTYWLVDRDLRDNMLAVVGFPKLRIWRI